MGIRTASTLPPKALVNTTAYSDRRLSGGHHSVLGNLSSRANINHGWKAWPSVGRIATDTLLSERYVQQCLRDLEAWGYIQNAGFTNGGIAYYLVIHQDTTDHHGVNTLLTGGGEHPPHPEHKKFFNTEKEQQPPTPIQLAGKQEGIVVVFPQAETAKATDANTMIVNHKMVTVDPKHTESQAKYTEPQAKYTEPLQPGVVDSTKSSCCRTRAINSDSSAGIEMPRSINFGYQTFWNCLRHELTLPVTAFSTHICSDSPACCWTKKSSTSEDAIEIFTF